MPSIPLPPSLPWSYWVRVGQAGIAVEWLLLLWLALLFVCLNTLMVSRLFIVVLKQECIMQVYCIAGWLINITLSLHTVICWLTVFIVSFILPGFFFTCLWMQYLPVDSVISLYVKQRYSYYSCLFFLLIPSFIRLIIDWYGLGGLVGKVWLLDARVT